jgi:hypothetical protein
MHTGVQSYFALNDAQVSSTIVQNRFMSFGTFSSHIQPRIIYGLTMGARLSGMMMDIDLMQRQATDKDNELTRLRAFILSQGARQSANEHLVAEAPFDDPNSSEKEAEAISAVKALQIATHSANTSSCVGAKQCFATPSSGQKIFTINQTNLGTVLPQLPIRERGRI